MTKYHSHKIRFSKANLARLRKRMGTIIKPDQIGAEDGIEVFMGKLKHNRLSRGKAKGKGVKLQLSEEEHQHNEGKGLGDLLHKVKAGYDKYVKPVAGDEIRSAVKSGAKTAIKAGLPALAAAVGAPELAPAAAAVANSKTVDRLVDKAVDKSGLGVKKRKRTAKPHVKLAAESHHHGHHHKIEANHSNFLNHRHPAQASPAPRLVDMSGFESARGFIPAGRGVSQGSYNQGTPMFPLLPHRDMAPRFGRGFRPAGGYR